MSKARVSRQEWTREWTRERAAQDRQWGQLVRQIRREPLVANSFVDIVYAGLDQPFVTIETLDEAEVKFLFLLAHLALGEGLSRATDPDRKGQ